jgi:hypothetical protein
MIFNFVNKRCNGVENRRLVLRAGPMDLSEAGGGFPTQFPDQNTVMKNLPQIYNNAMK